MVPADLTGQASFRPGQRANTRKSEDDLSWTDLNCWEHPFNHLDEVLNLLIRNDGLIRIVNLNI